MHAANTSKTAKKGRLPVWVYVLIAVVLAPFVGMKLAYQTFKNPSGSMLPTLGVGDYVLVRRFWSPPPRRGEVVVFRSPEHVEQSFFKRIVATPGDVVETFAGRTMINGWLAPHCRVGAFPVEGRPYTLYVEYLGDATYGTLLDELSEPHACAADTECERGLLCRGKVCGELGARFEVPTGEVWVMGDNRYNSHDSRTWFGGRGGGVPFANVQGSAAATVFGLDGTRYFVDVQGPPVLPASLASLKPALDRCVHERPPLAETTPPSR